MPISFLLYPQVKCTTFFDQKRVYAKAYAFFLLQEHFLEPRPLDGMFEKLSRTRGFADRLELTKN